jgi:hypothetical protein
MELLLLFLLFGFLPILIHYALTTLKIYPSLRIIKIIRKLLYFFISLMVLTIILNCFHWHWLGYKTDTFIYCCTATIYFIFYLLGTQKKDSGFKTTFHLFTFLLSTPTILLFSYAFYKEHKKIFYNTAHYRIENNERFLSFKAPKYILPKVYKKMGILEQRMDLVEKFHSGIDSIHNYFIDEPKQELVMVYSDSAIVKEKRYELK